MVISRVRIRVTPFGALIILLITCLLSPLPLQVWPNPQTRKPENPTAANRSPGTVNLEFLSPFSRNLRTHIQGIWAQRPYYLRLLGCFDAQGFMH